MCELKYFAFKKEQDSKKEEVKLCYECGTYFKEDNNEFVCQACINNAQQELGDENEDYFQRCCNED
jgi:hypothetical protein